MAHPLHYNSSLLPSMPSCHTAQWWADHSVSPQLSGISSSSSSWFYHLSSVFSSLFWTFIKLSIGIPTSSYDPSNLSSTYIILTKPTGRKSQLLAAIKDSLHDPNPANLHGLSIVPPGSTLGFLQHQRLLATKFLPHSWWLPFLWSSLSEGPFVRPLTRLIFCTPLKTQA